MNQYKHAAKLIKESKKTMVLTGAGISTESGIPDFRSKDAGLWNKMDPMEMLSAHVLYNNPEKFYQEGFHILTDIKDAKPNAGHDVIAKLEAEGLVQGVITQNIDNLHHKAGSKNIYEVHGQTRTATCTQCHKVYDFEVMEKKVEKGEIPPHCDHCHGMIRTDVVLFGDQMPAAFDGAVKELEDTELLIVVGTSLVVAPVSFLPRMVNKLIIINRDGTAFDRRADVVIHVGAGDALTAIYEEIHE